MLMTIEAVLTLEEVAHFRTCLAAAAWQDGGLTAGAIAGRVKHNLQLPDEAPLTRELGNIILGKLGRNADFVSAALPERIYPPKFNCYRDGGSYGTHVDAALMQLPGTNLSLRTDVSATLFLAEPDEYDGGELEIETPFGVQAVKLAAGDMVLYPSTSLHRVTPVTRGARIAAFFWIQSLVKDESSRTLLHDLDRAIQGLTPLAGAKHPDVLSLTGVYHNLLRRWAET